MTILIDNYDSFSYNLYQLVGRLTGDIRVVRNDQLTVPEIAALARSFVGKAPYVYGGAGPAGFDCSGFTMYIYGQFGIRLPHGATDQMRYGAAVDRSQLQPGDLIFFHDDYYSSSTASHCGIYVGNDQFVHASTYGSGGVLLTALNGNPYYSAHYIAARRMG